jgi:hypothetical protein
MGWFNARLFSLIAKTSLTCAALSGCGGGSGDPAEDAPLPLDEPTDALSFPDLYEDVFSTGLCGDSKCHGEQTQGGRLDLRDPEAAYEALVGVVAGGPKCIATGMMRVEPSDPEASLLYLKLLHESSPCGDVMPPVAIVMTDEDKEKVRAWIRAGALWEAYEADSGDAE